METDNHDDPLDARSFTSLGSVLLNVAVEMSPKSEQSCFNFESMLSLSKGSFGTVELFDPLGHKAAYVSPDKMQFYSEPEKTEQLQLASLHPVHSDWDGCLHSLQNKDDNSQQPNLNPFLCPRSSSTSQGHPFVGQDHFVNTAVLQSKDDEIKENQWFPNQSDYSTFNGSSSFAAKSDSVRQHLDDDKCDDDFYSIEQYKTSELGQIFADNLDTLSKEDETEILGIDSNSLSESQNQEEKEVPPSEETLVDYQMKPDETKKLKKTKKGPRQHEILSSTLEQIEPKSVKKAKMNKNEVEQTKKTKSNRKRKSPSLKPNDGDKNKEKDEKIISYDTIVGKTVKSKNLEITEASNKSGYKPFNRNQIPLIIRNYLTSHQWRKSAKMIMILTQDSRLYGDILLKTGLLIFDKKLDHRVQERDDIFAELERFNRLIQSIAGVSRIEATLEHLYLCFKYEKFEYIDRIIQTPIKYIKKHHSTEKKKVAANNFKGFIEFYKYYQHITHLMSAREGIDNQPSYASNSAFSHIPIIMGLREVTLKQDYPTDFYFLCLINLLVIYEKFEDAKDVLQEYVDKHPFNINAIFYLKKFNQKYLHSSYVDEICTKNLISLDPGHRHVIDWIEHVKDRLEQARVLFNFVDFIQNRHSVKAWKLLATLIEELWTDEAHQKTISRVYSKFFSSYWPAYHFVYSNDNLDENPPSPECLFYKAAIYILLESSDDASFVGDVKAILKKVHYELYRQLRSKLKAIKQTNEQN